MPGSMPATSQLDWLSSMTAMIVLFWSRATRDLLKSFGWGIAALHRENAATKLPFPRRPPHSVFRSRSCERLFWALPIGDGGTKGGATYRFRSETAMLAWSGCPQPFPSRRDRWFESASLHQRVCEPSVPQLQRPSVDAEEAAPHVALGAVAFALNSSYPNRASDVPHISSRS